MSSGDITSLSGNRKGGNFMRVTFLTQEDPLYILPFFDSFFQQELREIEVTAIFACRSMGNRKRTKLLRELLTLYGLSGFTKLLGLQVWSKLSESTGLSDILGTAQSIRQTAGQHGILYKRIDDPNSQDSIALIDGQRPDVLVSVACPFILKTPLLRLPTMAALNIHHAPLPLYKGMMPTFWQMYHGETSVGITIHSMSEKLDEGEILFQDSTPILPGETMHLLIRRSKRYGAHVMLQILQSFASGTPPQPLTKAAESSYFSFPTVADMKEFHRRGLSAI
jgi:methionyl-tRNA formyltransferase